MICNGKIDNISRNKPDVSGTAVSKDYRITRFDIVCSRVTTDSLKKDPSSNK